MGLFPKYREDTMPMYCIKHVLPGGTVAGYHADSGCTVVKSRENAKPADVTPEQAAGWLRQVRENFEYIWNLETSEYGGGPVYRAHPCWKGHSLDQIQTVLEEVTDPNVCIETRFTFID